MFSFSKPFLCVFFLSLLFTACGVPEKPLSNEEVERSTTGLITTEVAPTTMTTPSSPTKAAYPPPETTVIAEIPTVEPVVQPTVPPPLDAPLLRELWPLASDKERVTRLVYSAESIPTGENPLTRNDMWEVMLGTKPSPPKLIDIVPEDGTKVVAHLSPNGQCLSYFAGSTDNYSLYVMQVSSGERQLLNSRFERSDNQCFHTSAWSPDSTRLAYQQWWIEGDLFGEDFYVFDTTTNEKPRRVERLSRAPDLVGWISNNHILVLTPQEDIEKPLVLESIDVDTGERQMRSELPEGGSVFCAKISPDLTEVHLALTSQSYSFDVSSQTFRDLNTPTSRTLWGAEEDVVLTFSGEADQVSEVVEVSKQESTRVNLLPPLQEAELFGVVSTSPDGAFLVACTINETKQQYHSWIYKIQLNQWTELPPASRCVDVVGWNIK